MILELIDEVTKRLWLFIVSVVVFIYLIRLGLVLPHYIKQLVIYAFVFLLCGLWLTIRDAMKGGNKNAKKTKSRRT